MATKPTPSLAVAPDAPSDVSAAITAIRAAILKARATMSATDPAQAFTVQHYAFHAMGKMDELRIALGRLGIGAAYSEAV